jgi:hypothetical protein
VAARVAGALLTVLGCLSSPVLAADNQTSPVAQPPMTLCRQDEAVVFSCRVPKGKYLSLCASPNASATQGYMAYRFGRDPSSIELEYPGQPGLAKNNFRYLYSWFPKGSTVAVSFWMGQFRYSVFRTVSAFGYNGAGVIVNRGEKAIRVTSKMCEGDEVVPATYESALSFFNLKARLQLSDANGDISTIDVEPGSDQLQAKPGEPEDWQLRRKR